MIVYIVSIFFYLNIHFQTHRIDRIQNIFRYVQTHTHEGNKILHILTAKKSILIFVELVENVKHLRRWPEIDFTFTKFIYECLQEHHHGK